MRAMLNLARSRLNFRWFYSMRSAIFPRKLRKNTNVTCFFVFARLLSNHERVLQRMGIRWHSARHGILCLLTLTSSSNFLNAMTVGNYKRTVSTILLKKALI